MLTDELRTTAVSRVRERYAAEGFEAATVTMEVCPRSPGEVDVVFLIDEGPPLLIDAIDIAGTLPLPADEVRDAIGVEAGDRFTRAEQRHAQTAIVRLFREQAATTRSTSSSTWERGRRAPRRAALHDRRRGRCSSIRFSGNQHFSDSQAARADGSGEPADRHRRYVARAGAARATRLPGGRLRRCPGRRCASSPGRRRWCASRCRKASATASPRSASRATTACRRRSCSARWATRPPSWIPWRRGVFLEDVFDDDLKRLWYFYRRQGFEAAEIVDAQTRFDAARGKVFVTVFIEEGPRTIVRDGPDGRAPRRLPASCPSCRWRMASRWTRMPWKPIGARWRTRSRSDGYTQAVVKATVDHRTRSATRWRRRCASRRSRASSNASARSSSQNNFDTHARVITRELPFKRGDPLNPDALLQGQSNIYRLGLFRSVTVRPLEHRGGAPATDVGVQRLREAARAPSSSAAATTRATASAASARSGTTTCRDWRAASVCAASSAFDPGSASFNDYIGNLGFREPRLDDTKWTFRSNLLAQRSTRSIDEYSVERYAFIPAVERILSPGFQVGSRDAVRARQRLRREAGRAGVQSARPGQAVDRQPRAVCDLRRARRRLRAAPRRLRFVAHQVCAGRVGLGRAVHQGGRRAQPLHPGAATI